MLWVGVLLLVCSPWVMVSRAYDLDPDDPKSVKYVAGRVAQKLMEFYPGENPGRIPGLFDYPPYYWWEAGAVFGALVDYWYYTGDTTYNGPTTRALIHQAGPGKNYMPHNQTSAMGNDDQAFWALAAMNAAEKKFPDPPPEEPQWLALVQAVFNLQVKRLREEEATYNCGGGLRWQAIPLNGGYDYKNTISNGCFFQLGARLARYTGNDTYAEWAEKIWDWTEKIGFITPEYSIIDGGWINATSNCTTRSEIRWSYNAGVYLGGAAFMYDYTKKDIWKERIDKMLDYTFGYFFPGNNDIMVESACETLNPPSCNVDQRSFKAYLSRFLTYVRILAPWTAPRIATKIKASSIAAAKRCSRGQDQNTCGLRWYTPVDEWEGMWGVGEQLAALEVIQSNLVKESPEEFADSKTGTSIGDPSAGGDVELDLSHGLKPVTTADKGGAGTLTGLVALAMLGLSWWLMKP
ncbi:mannan endo-1,6-alpha-mannosidase [Ascodesmis nigricans]|uniref:Mannan endo-1,6-alpha-mannosidase n=1 Tax=Ascodesmis nigricans TaxID=341454 RepID=A0A4S2N7A8_9PEZI|nr:mannan endo-1,6-alpha-mannosidase [Ascodesmis nigricans]